MLATFSSIHVCYICSSEPIGRKQFCIQSQPRSKNTFVLASQETLLTRRIAVISIGTTLVSGLIYNTFALPIRAEEDNNRNDTNDEGDNGAFGTIKSIFDPDEKTKTGKLLPKAYLKDAREVVKTLRESLEEDVKDASKFRRRADAAKDSIRQYLSNWKGQSTVLAEESYAAIEKAIRTLANFYSKEGPFATMTDEVKATILGDLKTAEDFL